MELTVTIAGAGLGGLCLAQRLLRAGIDVRVYEADPEPFARRQGYRITVDADGLAALRDSLPAELYRLALATGGEPGGYFRITDAQLRDAIKLTFPATPDGGRQMDRQLLRSILLIGLDERVQYGKRAVAVEPDGAELVLRFADGGSARSTVVVGADGIGSALRSRIAPGADPADSGVSGIYGRTPLVRGGRDVIPDALRKSGVLAIGDEPGRAFFLTTMRFGQPPVAAFASAAPGRFVPAGDDYVMWGLVLRRGEAPTGDPRAAAARLATGFHPLVGRLVEGADDDATILTSFAVGSRPARWPLAGATLIGDAVHAMPPFGAHGGNTALRDAALLGAKLAAAHASGGPVAGAIAAYQDEMARYAFDAVDRSARMMRRITATGGFQKWLMTRVLPRLHRVTVADTVSETA
jgi:2-polyprenyl-6-methoxyphenol hydroxylase-like FAD-dependent oxidoreductase